MMKSLMTERGLRTAGIVFCLLLFGSQALAQQTSGTAGPQSSGPKPSVGETVIAPKTTPPKPVEPAKKPERVEPRETFSMAVTTGLVNVDVIVTDNKGNFIPSLSKKNFRISEDGVEQSITNFSRGQAPMTICLLIEYNVRWWFLLYETLRDAYTFLNVLEPQDWVAVVSYDLRPEILADFTQDKREVVAALNQLRMGRFSESCPWDAIDFVLDRMKDIKGKKAILMLTTGLDTFSKITYDQAVKKVRASDAIIYPISIGGWLRARGYEDIENYQADAQLRQFANLTGGMAYFPRFETELPNIYNEISQQLRNQYSLAYIPTNSARDGKFRKIKIALVDENGNPLQMRDEKNKPVKFRILAREGYSAPKS